MSLSCLSSEDKIVMSINVLQDFRTALKVMFFGDDTISYSIHHWPPSNSMNTWSYIWNIDIFCVKNSTLGTCMQKLWARMPKIVTQISLFYFKLLKFPIKDFSPMARFKRSEFHIFVKNAKFVFRVESLKILYWIQFYYLTIL